MRRRRDNIKVTSVANISTGDKIRLDIDSVGHGSRPSPSRKSVRSRAAERSAEASRGYEYRPGPRRERMR
jgi:hypothetical protein